MKGQLYDPNVIIAVDAGNSALKVAQVEGTEVSDRQRVPASAATDDVSRAAVAHRIVADAAASGARITLVSVVPAWTAAFRQAASNLNVTLLVADHTTIPIQARVTHPGDVGADRLLAAFAAREIHGSPVIVVDLGTATTVDGVDADGAFAGGAILPGPELSAQTLARGTAQLPAVTLDLPDRALGRDTAEAIRAGVVLGHAEAVSGLIRRVAAELIPARQRVTVILTGGGSAAPWAAAIRGIDSVDPDLVLRGLGLLADRAAQVAR